MSRIHRKILIALLLLPVAHTARAEIIYGGFIRNQTFLQDPSTYYVNTGYVDGELGINVPISSAPLHIRTGSGGGMQRAVKIEHGSPTINKNGVYIEFAASSVDTFGGQIGGIREEAGGLGAIVIRTGAASQVERLRVTDSGNVGIGISNPSTKLHISSGVVSISHAGGGLSISSTSVAGSTVAVHYGGSASLDFGAVGGLTCSDLTMTVTGSQSGDSCFLGPSATLGATTGLQFSCFVSAPNTVTVRACCSNSVLVAVPVACPNPAAAVVKVSIWRDY